MNRPAPGAETEPRADGAARPAVRIGTAAAPGRAGEAGNEDYAAAGDGWAFVLDGATRRPGLETGCRHGVRWFVHRLGAALAAELTATGRTRSGERAGRTRAGEPAGPAGLVLPGLVAAAIAAVRPAHGGRCDLDNLDSPSSTVAVVRIAGGLVEYLALGDSPILLAHRDGRVDAVVDDRCAGLPGGRPYSDDLVRRWRNRPGGFWVAQTSPGAAHRALTGSVPVADLAAVALLSDGAAGWHDRFGRPWRSLVDVLAGPGPGRLIELVRAAERELPAGAGKRHDDATAVFVALSTPVSV